jgi:hypothetical protein
MVKNSKIILSCLISIMLATSASAGWVPLTGDPVPISSLPDGILTFGDKMLSEIYVFGTGTGGAIAPTADSISVQGGYDDANGDYGLWFLLSCNAFSGQTINATLNFKISVLPSYDANYIKDVKMYITGASATSSGGVNIGETVRNAPPPEGSDIALLSCSVQESGAKLYDHEEFAPLKEIWIWSKDISITGGTDLDGSGHLSGFLQFYSQSIVPEPATLVLLGTASIWIFTRKKRSA